MLGSVEIEAIELVIAQLDILIEKYEKKVNKEKEKVKNASVTYKGEKYHSFEELQDAYACDVFDSDTFDKLEKKLNKAMGNGCYNTMTKTEPLLIQLQMIKSNYITQLQSDRNEKYRNEKREKRMEELHEQGYSYREAAVIIGNEELMAQE